MNSSLTAISPLDGRYSATVSRLAKTVSEYGLIRYRVLVECEYLKALAKESALGLTLSPEEIALIGKIADVSEEDAAIVKKIEVEGHDGVLATRHDVKAVEYFIKGKLKGTSLEQKGEWVHFGLTSEDVNNISYALMLRDASKEVGVSLEAIVTALEALAVQHAGLSMLARTHGQSATPTTFGKEMRIFVGRLKREQAKAESFELLAKLNGATGNYNALAVAFPSVDWASFSQRFIESFNVDGGARIAFNPYTGQIEPHDSYAELFQLYSRINTILIDFDQDIWRYISDGWIKQTPKAGEVGSSTMPHKVNPIDFENSEGNLGLANALFGFFASKLPISRLQRDLSDSTVQRNFGAAFAHALMGYESILKGLSRVEPDAAKMAGALDAHPEVLAEAIQTILRREGEIGAYEKLKELTRGASLSIDDICTFVWALPLPEKVREELVALSPSAYVGYAERLAKGA